MAAPAEEPPLPRAYKFDVSLGDAENPLVVGYSAKKRPRFLSVRFQGPAGPLVRPTECKRVDANFHAAVKTLIKDAYGIGGKLAPALVLLTDALGQVIRENPGLRPATVAGYCEAVTSVLALLPCRRVAEFDRLAADRYARLLLSTPYSRSPKSDAVKRFRSAGTLRHYLGGLSALWGKFAAHGLVARGANPWADVAAPDAPRERPRVPTEAQYNDFVAWLKARYPTWEMLHALVELKALTCCRNLDLASLKSAQVAGGRVEFGAAQAKTRRGRGVPLLPALAAALGRGAGPDWLWEGLLADADRHRPSSTRRGPFTPRSVIHLLQNLFREYNEARPGEPRLRPHDLRRRGITLLVEQTQSVEAAAQAVGVLPQTARAHYLDAKRAFDTDALFAAYGAKLVGRSGQEVDTVPCGEGGEPAKAP